MTPSDVESRETREIRTVALAAFVLNLLLAVSKYLVSRTTGSLALTASVVDSTSDSLASLAVFAGVLLSSRKTASFPLGLYKIENVISVVVAVFIFIAGYEIAKTAFTRVPAPLTGSPLAIGTMAANTVVVFAFGRYALHRGRVTGSPALVAEGHHRQADVLSSLAVLAALVAEAIGLHFNVLGVTPDRLAAIAVLVFVARAGWDLLSDGMRVLLDAALPPEQLDEIRTTILADPAVVEVRGLYGRNAGRFVFVQATVAIRGDGLGRAHAISHRIEGEVRAAVPRVDRVVIHYEPSSPDEITVAIPVADGAVSPHFGEAPEFAFIRCRRSDSSVLEATTEANPHASAPRGRGTGVAKWLTGRGIAALIVGAELHGGNALPTLENAGVVVHATRETDPEAAVREYLGQSS